MNTTGTRWTPGEWDRFCGEILGGGECIADCGDIGPGPLDEERARRLANANLIASAPTLYEALAALVAAHTSPRFEEDIADALEDAERAMKRARGEDPGPRAPRQEPEPYNPYRL
jgi:hypothetical protein